MLSSFEPFQNSCFRRLYNLVYRICYFNSLPLIKHLLRKLHISLRLFLTSFLDIHSYITNFPLFCSRSWTTTRSFPISFFNMQLSLFVLNIIKLGNFLNFYFICSRNIKRVHKMIFPRYFYFLNFLVLKYLRNIFFLFFLLFFLLFIFTFSVPFYLFINFQYKFLVALRSNLKNC